MVLFQPGWEPRFSESRLLSGKAPYEILRRARELTMAFIELTNFTFLKSTLRYKAAAR